MAPWKCPECGIWWAGLEHRCPLVLPETTAWPTIATGGTITLSCTCYLKGQTMMVICPIHDVRVAYTKAAG